MTVGGERTNGAEMTRPPTIAAVLEDEHRWIDERLEEFQRGLAEGRADAGSYEEAATKLHRHIYLEEEMLFPQVETRGLAGPTAVMMMEHGKICQQLDAVRDLLASGAEASQVLEVFGALRGLLEEHNGKEEQIFYPASDHLLTEAELAEVLARVEDAETPAGWLCRAQRG
jgi:regulator of cell morphogenesis and NO signaling